MNMSQEEIKILDRSLLDHVTNALHTVENTDGLEMFEGTDQELNEFAIIIAKAYTLLRKIMRDPELSCPEWSATIKIITNIIPANHPDGNEMVSLKIFNKFLHFVGVSNRKNSFTRLLRASVALVQEFPILSPTILAFLWDIRSYFEGKVLGGSFENSKKSLYTIPLHVSKRNGVLRFKNM